MDRHYFSPSFPTVKKVKPMTEVAQGNYVWETKRPKQMEQLHNPSRTREAIFRPNDYMKAGDKKISAPPLVNTSFAEMAEYGWYLFIDMRIIRAPHGHTGNFLKAKVEFFNPLNRCQRFVFKFWEEYANRNLDFVEDLDMLNFVHDRELSPKFTNLMHKGWLITPPAEVPELSELEFLERINKERGEALVLPKEPAITNIETLSEDVIEAMIFEFPRMSTSEIETKLEEFLAA